MHILMQMHLCHVYFNDHIESTVQEKFTDDNFVTERVSNAPNGDLKGIS